jgi:hypothetical protein
MGSDRTSYRTRIVLGMNRLTRGVTFQVSSHILLPRQRLQFLVYACGQMSSSRLILDN